MTQSRIESPPDQDWHVGGWTIERRLTVGTVIALVSIIALGAKLYYRVDALEQRAAAIQTEQAEGKERADQRQVDTQRYIDEAVKAGRAAREGLEARVRATENQYAGVSAQLQGLGAQLTGIGADVRDLRKSIEESRARER
ncbi:hypothetical protein [Amaricoccus solimangrovi]|uniref:Uncharacterized protein n=1 Tax=Amaricoccus solimangrovi TaxID=2589815 RepID=A0A501WXW3_9RHOB|nr:hypothetical protein [Amaricoccus solimangrovi]TPE53085.1 hypothetical protein FJM51_03415 [Amaricoccus solimangrovi]